MRTAKELLHLKWMSWITILNPSQMSWTNLENLMDASYNLCIDQYRKKISQ
jgi:predicted DNA-binding protein (MmcQ/YjbR family)